MVVEGRTPVVTVAPTPGSGLLGVMPNGFIACIKGGWYKSSKSSLGSQFLPFVNEFVTCFGGREICLRHSDSVPADSEAY